MGVRTRDTSRIPGVRAVLEELQRLAVEVGVFGDDDGLFVRIARVHEFGMTITPRRARNLAIPLPAAGDTRPADWGDQLFVPKGTHVLGRKLPNGEFEGLFVLVPSVTIPERSFMRSSWDESQDELKRVIDRLLPAVLTMRLSPRDFYERLGIWMVSRIQNKIRSLKDPPNSALTAERKGSTNPLIDTGRLIQSITYRVVER